MLNKILHGDCLLESEKIESSSIDLILTDLPYGTVKTLQMARQKTNPYHWDIAIDPKKIFKIANRILRKNGRLILFGQEPYTSKLIREAIPNLPFSYRMVWEKDNFANAFNVKKAPVSYFEDIIVFSKMHDHHHTNNNPLRILLKKYADEFGKENIIRLFKDEGRYTSEQSARVHAAYKMGFSNGVRFDLMDEKLYDYLNDYISFEETYKEMRLLYHRNNPLKDYFQSCKRKSGMSNKEFNYLFSDFYNKVDNRDRSVMEHYWSDTQFYIPTKEVYEKILQPTGYFPMPYEKVKSIYEKHRKESSPSTFNLWEGKKYKSNILKYKKDYDGYHPTQKPVLLLEDLIKTYSNEDDTVVDLTCGSGSTCVAALNTKRNFIGIEKEKEYVDIANDRIKENDKQLVLSV